MFDLLRRIFPDKAPEKLPVADHRIEEREPIVALLMRASTHHVLFSVRLSGQEESFSTALLGIYDEHDFIILDELSPENGHLLLKDRDELKLSGRLEGVELGFTTSVLEIRKKNGVAYYKARLPETIEHHQQRNAYRIPSRGVGITFHGLRGKGMRQIVKGYVNDLSRDGAGIILAEGIQLYQGEILPSCIISVPGEGEIAFSLEVCFCSRNPRQQVTRIGGRFKNIDPASLQKIGRCLNRIERTQLRRIKGG